MRIFFTTETTEKSFKNSEGSVISVVKCLLRLPREASGKIRACPHLLNLTLIFIIHNHC